MGAFMAKKNKNDELKLTDEQLVSSNEYIETKNGEKDEIRIPKWVNSILENDAKNYFFDNSATKNTVVSCALFSFDLFLKDQKDKTSKLLDATYAYAKNKWNIKPGKIDEKNIIANLSPSDFKFINDVSLITSPYSTTDKNVVLRVTPNKKNAWVLNCFASLYNTKYDYNVTMTDCISTVLIWYASFPGYKREQIIKQDIFNDIQKALISKEEKGRFYDFYMESGKIMTMCPYKLVTHNEGIHNYIIGVGSEEHYNPVSLRLDRISKILPNYNILTKDEFLPEEKDILDSMAKYGPEFTYPTFNKPITIIRLSEEAQRMYNRVYIHRPLEISKVKNDDGSYDYTFDCTEMQLLNYFKKFDAEYKIIKSDTLKEKLSLFYKKALQMLD